MTVKTITVTIIINDMDNNTEDSNKEETIYCVRDGKEWKR